MFRADKHGAATARSGSVSRRIVLLSLLVLVAIAPAATLQRLTLDDMSDKATAIISGKVVSSYTATHGNMIATHYKIQVSETWKGPVLGTVEVMLPGGIAGGVRQSFAGVPQLAPGKQYLMFLWAGKSGYNQLLGLTQGLFDLANDSTGTPVVSRRISAEMMLDESGTIVQDQAVNMTLEQMSARVTGRLARTKVVQ